MLIYPAKAQKSIGLVVLKQGYARLCKNPPLTPPQRV